MNEHKLEPEVEQAELFDPKYPELLFKDLDQYVDLVSKIKDLTTTKDLLNKRIKLALSKGIIAYIKAKAEPFKEEVSIYQDAIIDLELDFLPEEEAASAEARRVESIAILTSNGITPAMLDILLDDNTSTVLEKHKVDETIGSHSVKTSIQDRSVMDQKRAVEFLKSKGMNHLLTTQTVVNESALEMEIYNGNVDAKQFKAYAIDEKLVVTLTVK